MAKAVACMTLMKQVVGSNPEHTDHRTGCSLVVARNHANGRYNFSKELID